MLAGPGQVNQRRYEALRAYLHDGASLRQAADATGYTRAALASLVRDLRAGRLTLFAPPGVPGRKSAPKKDAARGRVIELRRDGLSAYEISARLGREGTPLGRSAVSDVLREEGFGRLLRGPEPQASISPATSGRDTALPPAAVIDFAALPGPRAHHHGRAAADRPGLVALDLPGLVKRAGYPGTRKIPAASYLLSLLALKLTATRRVSHVDDLLCDPAPALLAGLSVLPKKTALTDYSYRLSHDHQRAFLAALDQKMIAAGLATSEEAIFDLDFHAVMHWGADPALEKHYVPTRSQRSRSVLTFFAQDSGTHNLVYANADLTKATQHREAIAFCDHWKQASGSDPRMLIMDQKVHHPADPRRAGAILIEGSARCALGIAAAASGRLDDAIRHLRVAVEVNEGAGLPGCAAFARLQLARALSRRRPGDRDEAAALATSAGAVAGDLGMVPLRAAADRFLAVLAGRGRGGLSQREAQVAAYVGRGSRTGRSPRPSTSASGPWRPTSATSSPSSASPPARSSPRGTPPAANGSVPPVSRTTDGSGADQVHAPGMTTSATTRGHGRRLPCCVPPACSTARARCPTRP